MTLHEFMVYPDAFSAEHNTSNGYFCMATSAESAAKQACARWKWADNFGEMRADRRVGGMVYVCDKSGNVWAIQIRATPSWSYAPLKRYRVKS